MSKRYDIRLLLISTKENLQKVADTNYTHDLCRTVEKPYHKTKCLSEYDDDVQPILVYTDERYGVEIRATKHENVLLTEPYALIYEGSFVLTDNKRENEAIIHRSVVRVMRQYDLHYLSFEIDHEDLDIEATFHKYDDDILYKFVYDLYNGRK